MAPLVDAKTERKLLNAKKSLLHRYPNQSFALIEN
jgi:hypothetical protein